MAREMLEKWASVCKEARSIAEFLEWCLLSGKDPINDMTPTRDLIYEYFGIDATQLEQECRELRESLEASL